MIRTLYVIALTLLIQTWCLAQTPDSTSSNPDYIINAKSYNRGIYKTFEEFKYNKPSITDFSVYEGRPMIADPKTGKKKHARERDTWGYCDGSKVYVRRVKYIEMIGMGRYCYFTQKGVKVMVNPRPAMLVIPLIIPYKDVIIINFNTGKQFILKKRLMKVILAKDDPELLNQFKADTQKKKKLIGYVNLYNQRNARRIK